MPSIKAAVCHEFGAPLVVEDVELRAPEMGEIEVTLDACAICHSDISYADGAWGGSLPAVYGHEAAGLITAVGGGVQGLVLGDSVVVTLIRACGSCASCAEGTPVLCTTPYDGDQGPLKKRNWPLPVNSAQLTVFWRQMANPGAQQKRRWGAAPMRSL